MKPKILVSASNTKTLTNYLSAVNTSGGEPYPIFSETADSSKFDALLLCGGGDISPKFYGKENEGSTNIDEKRDISEFMLLEAFIKSKKPVFGICRGHQIINVFFGGSLIQDIESSKFHKGLDEGDNFHSVDIKPGTILSRLYGRAAVINSSHHQAAGTIGKDLIMAASWHEEINEALEHIKLPIFSVQWHPERIYNPQNENNTATGKKLFDYFISLC